MKTKPMSYSIRTKRKLSVLWLALALSVSFISQSGYPLPIASEPLPAYTKDIVYVQLEAASGKTGVDSAPSQSPASASVDKSLKDGSRKTPARKNKKKKKKKKKVVWGPLPTRHGLFRRPIFDQSVSNFSLQPIQAPWRHEMRYSLVWSLGPQFMDQIVAIQQNHTPVDIQQGAAKDTDLQGVGQDKRPTTPYELLLIDIHLVPLDPARPSELLLSKIPLSVLRARFHLRTEISPGWYRLEIHFWDKGRNSDHQGTTTTEALDKHGVWDLSTSSLVQSPGVAKSMAFDSIQAREVGIWRGAEAIEVTTLSPEFKEWSEFVATTSDKVHQERWSAVDAGEFDSVIYSQQEQQQQHQRSTYENPFQLSKAARGFSAELHDMIMGLIYGVGRADATSFERADFPQETFRFKEAMDIMTGRDMAPDFVDEELEEMQEEGSIGKDVQETWNTAIEQLNGLMTVWDDTSPDNADDDVMDQNESYGAPSTDLIDFGVRIEHGREIIQPWTSTTWRANRDRTVSWQTSDGLVRDRMLLAVELIKAPDVSVEAGSVTGTRVRTRAELAKESLKQPCEAVLTDRVPASWGAVVVRMPTWVLTGAYQLRLKGVGGQGTEWADVSQPFVVQSDPYLYY